MLITPVPMFLASSGIVFPAVTINRANIDTSGVFGHNSYGYIRSGGIYAGLVGTSGGSLSATLVPGYVTDVVVDIFDGDQIAIAIVGDCAALLAGVTALMDNGTPLPLDAPFQYSAGEGITGAYTAPGNGWSATGNRTIQLV